MYVNKLFQLFCTETHHLPIITLWTIGALTSSKILFSTDRCDVMSQKRKIMLKPFLQSPNHLRHHIPIKQSLYVIVSEAHL
ncbi:hypothetical protein ES319_A05G376100v1 [Gossypium barbadense]|uniref:Uncharacterized protein n=2 Tax=Gossypium TaxID=3633 RepID=A0A5J5VY41_GOSBA|nr:hypothetical protein ES319_A05G376100v1 [Gossypium barbadense]TYH20033.1 hypothetical protein ES288_A05G399500v1 [Gossypium darwinii]